MSKSFQQMLDEHTRYLTDKATREEIEAWNRAARYNDNRRNWESNPMNSRPGIGERE